MVNHTERNMKLDTEGFTRESLIFIHFIQTYIRSCIILFRKSNTRNIEHYEKKNQHSINRKQLESVLKYETGVTQAERDGNRSDDKLNLTPLKLIRSQHNHSKAK